MERIILDKKGDVLAVGDYVCCEETNQYCMVTGFDNHFYWPINAIGVVGPKDGFSFRSTEITKVSAHDVFMGMLTGDTNL